MRPARLVAFTLFFALAGVVFWLRARDAELQALGHFEGDVRRLAMAGDVVAARALLTRASELQPERARDRRGIFERALRIAEVALQLTGTPRERERADRRPLPPHARLQPLRATLPPSGILLVAAGVGDDPPFARVLPEYAKLLGYPGIQRAAAADVAAAPAGSTVFVVADPDLELPGTLARRVYLGPNQQAERALALSRVSPEAPALRGCQLRVRDPMLGPLAASGTSVPVPVPVTPLAAGPAVHVLATVTCGERTLPAIVQSGDRSVVMVAFDLPRALVYLRQGDPAQAMIEHDGQPGLRPSDLFDQPRTVDEMRVPHADLLVEGLMRLAHDGQPLLRFWPHPRGAPASLVLTADQDYAGIDELQLLVRVLRARKLRVSCFLSRYNPRSSDLRGGVPELRDWVRWLIAQHVDLGIHPDYLGTASGEAAAFLRDDREAFRRNVGQPVDAGRFHYVRWWGFQQPVELLAKLGQAWDLSYLTIPSQQHPVLGFMTGSGVGLRYYGPDGEPLAVRQLATQLDDFAYRDAPGADSEASTETPAEAHSMFAMTAALLDAVAVRHHAAVVLNHHPELFARSPQWLLYTLDRAAALDLAVLDLRGYRDFAAGLRASEIGRAGPGAFEVLAQNPDQTLMVSADVEAVLIDGLRTAAEPARRFGQAVGLLPIARGKHSVQLLPR